MPPRAHVSALALALAACGGKDGDGTREVSGALVVDGTRRAVTGCIVRNAPLGGTRLTLAFAGGAVTYEDDRLYLARGDAGRGVVRGEPLVCLGVTGERVAGSSSNGPGFMHGTLAAECSGPTPVTLDLTLACGTIDPEAQRQIDELRRRGPPE
jgi:hypothetical protein